MDNAQRIERVKKMEEIYVALLKAAKDGRAALAGSEDMLRQLKEYYAGGLWLSDYEADEQGEFPADMKRGVLSQDGVYDLLCDIENIMQA